MGFLSALAGIGGALTGLFGIGQAAVQEQESERNFNEH